MQPAQDYIEEVRNQYEDYPYPPRDPEGEKKYLLASSSESLDLVNHYCFGGKRDVRKNFRALVAGGGTGDASIFLAEQLRDTDAEIIHLDISEASMAVAKERAKIRGLDNITWEHASLLSLPKMSLGKFDFINCCGVLHHLESPKRGLLALKSALKSDGAMSIMVYARYGRTGVYQMQNLMRMINGDEKNAAKKVENCEKVLADLPPSNWFKRGEDLYADHKLGDPAGVYDLLLHSHDVSYDVLDLYEWVESCGLQIGNIPFNRGQGRLLYKPSSYIKDPELLAEIEKLPPRNQQAIAELINGSIRKHMFYAMPKKVDPPSVDDLDNIPFFSQEINDKDMHEKLAKSIQESDKSHVTIKQKEIKVSLKLTPISRLLFIHMDGNRTFREIYDAIRVACKEQGEPEHSDEELGAEFKKIYDVLNQCDLLALRHKSIPPFISRQEIQARVEAQYR